MTAADIPDTSRPGAGRETTMASRAVTLSLLLVSTVYFLFPLWWLLVSVTKPFGRQFSGNGLWFDGFGLFENISRLTEQNDGIFWRWMLNSVLYCGIGALAGTLLSAMAGYLLAKYRFRGRNALFGTVLAAVLIPKILFTLPLYLMFSGIGLIDNPLAVLLPSIVSPFGVYLARIFAAQSVPDEVIEAGRLDGASEFRIFRTVALPMMLPALVTIFLFQFVDIWNNYLLPAMVLSDDRLQPVTVGLVGWNASHGVAVPAPLVVIGSLVSVVPLIVAFVALQRFWRAGMTAGAVK
ncbi:MULTISPECIES: carbohydrate ABC transporter permease [unclassified Streptomyces]|uniref:carbohydrate ABC transporter permease n=1 Tax=unclassified Streptomyces TaxID=2593676 RepID=UPI0001C1C017|nr:MULTISPECIES: carbohydrate ABC transporter permease [unclassified Streptomyces]AEN14281.1 binding-protein-dependent transport systems inner membrane component [Streptomyces sp. SirexAA-E]MYR66702.1 ABC transporter permease subunit [Streptomyces sp. SID4939]MYS03510.1 ABC transporter permease subunit [Streptomyces sp. SID4940]MYT65914.1 ABC transporter permease subunit [Streptomyces sp. SID8357]MYT85572.1 ABC transporter permease subunit [Streptomyces sp. SID8360]